MEKLVGFATKITLRNYSARTDSKKEVRRIVQHQSVKIDRDVFRKTDDEKDELKRLKRANKLSTPQEREEFLGYFVKAKLPNWNLSFILAQ